MNLGDRNTSVFHFTSKSSTSISPLLLKVDGIIKAHKSIMNMMNGEHVFDRYYGIEITMKLDVGQKVWIEVIGNYLSHSFFHGALLY